MKAVSSSSSWKITIFFLFIAILSTLVSSQTDTCNPNSNLNDVNGILFDTASLQCASVWNSHDFILRFGQSSANKSVWSFVLSASDPNSYVAVGFSERGRMERSTAVVGWVTTGGTPTIRRYYLAATNPAGVVLDQGNVTVVRNTAVILRQSSRLYMAFQVEVSDGGNPRNQLLYAVGPDGFYPVEPNLRLVQHREMIATTINYGTGSTASKSSPHLALRRSHGIFNMLGWGILMIIGAMVARYCKQWDPLWFYLHVGIQSVALLMGISGFLCGFLLENRLNANVSTHKGLGVFIFVLGCLQAAALLARPGKTAKNRKYWNWYHYTVGRVLIVFAIANVFYGIKLGGEGAGWTGGYAFVICILVITAAVLEYRLWTSDNI